MLALADVAEFLPPPATLIPKSTIPDAAKRDSLIALAANYVNQTIPKLPDFFATRVTTRFEDRPAEVATLDGPTIPYAPLRVVGVSSTDVLNRDGQEVEEAGAKTEKASGTAPSAFTTSGEFGPVLIALMTDVFKGQIVWSRWESGKTGPLAVFSYSVPRQSSSYLVHNPGRWGDSAIRPAYRGEITVDPADGTITRLTLEAELKADDPVTRADLMVEYGPVEIGGKIYSCPTRSVALSAVRVIRNAIDRQGMLSSGFVSQQIQLNDVRFENYHLLRSEIHIMAEDASKPAASQGSTSPSK